MNLNASVSFRSVSRRGRRAVFASALLAILPTATLALGSRSEVPTKKLGLLLVAEAQRTPVQFMLKCKVVRTDEIGRMAVTTFAKEPFASNDSKFKIITAPTIRTLLEQRAMVSASIDGLQSGANLLVRGARNGQYQVDIESFVLEKWSNTVRGSDPQPPFLHSFRTWAVVGANEWVAFRLLNAAGRFNGHLMFVQIVPFKEE